MCACAGTIPGSLTAAGGGDSSRRWSRCRIHVQEHEQHTDNPPPPTSELDRKLGHTHTHTHVCKPTSTTACLLPSTHPPCSSCSLTPPSGHAPSPPTHEPAPGSARGGCGGDQRGAGAIKAPPSVCCCANCVCRRRRCCNHRRWSDTQL